MLYNPKWNDTQPSLAGFVEWLERQPADKEYEWSNCEKCAIAQYVWSVGSCYHGMDCGLKRAFERLIAAPSPHTFGAAAKRARALMTEQRT